MALFSITYGREGVLTKMTIECESADIASRVHDCITDYPRRFLSPEQFSGATRMVLTVNRSQRGPIEKALARLASTIEHKRRAASGAIDLGAARRERLANENYQGKIRMLVPVETEAPPNLIRDGATLHFSGYGRTWFIPHDDFSVHGLDPTMTGEVRYAYYC